ncbi:MAG: GDP-mannose 4,6-dehydratase [Fusobacteriaceae bacterium]|nr:GDP-mannose 4,6-dehydratase [Fusobacteriaceae bacterium]
MKYLVTGILGHACPHLARLLLNEGHTVHALIRGTNGNQYNLLDLLTPEEIEKITFQYGDLKDYNSLLRIFSQNKFDGVFHLGAQSHPPTAFQDPRGTMETNVYGTVNLIEAVRETGQGESCVICNVSTSEVYGDECKDVGILKEDMPLKPSNPYGWSKACAEMYLRERCKNGESKGFSTRAFSHLAPRRGNNFSISWDAFHLAYFKKAIEHGYDGEIILPVGNLETQRVVIDARDVMRAYYLLMQKFHEFDKKTKKFYGIGNKNPYKEVKNPLNGESFNVCGGLDKLQKMEYFTNKLIEISGLENVQKKIDKRVYRPIDIQIQIGDTTKLLEAIDWKPEIPIEQTLKDVYEYWLKKLS